MIQHRFQLPFVFAFFLTFLLPPFSSAQENSDTEAVDSNVNDSGCSDLAVFRRLGTSTILSCHKDPSMDVTMPLPADAQGYSRQKTVHGAYEFREYRIPSELQDLAFDNLMQLLPMSGFTVKYSASPSTITARKENTWILINVSEEFYNVSVVTSNEESWTFVKDAEGISQEMSARSRVAIYGIEFSPDNNSIVGENATILGEVLRYLKENPSLTVVVESHKSSIDGNEQADLDVTSKRAKTITAWFEAHGIATGRLQPKGLGRSKPITENDTPLEIQRNERIELAKPAS